VTTPLKITHAHRKDTVSRPAFGERPKAAVTADMVIPNVSVRQMIEKADFETCIFATNPPWTAGRRIFDVLDVGSPPHRMFTVSYGAKDGRHIVLVQSPTYNAALGAKTKLPEAKLVYQSPKGFKVWSGPADRMAWLADILLQSAGYAKPSEQRTGHLLETPAGTFPALAINGQVTDAELHTLIDSLVLAREYKGE